MNAPSTEAERPDDGPLLGLLRGLAEHVPCDALDELWIFPPRRVGATESAVVVAAAFDEPEPSPAGAGTRRRVLTARYTARHDDGPRPSVRNEFTEHGSAPADRIARLIEGVLRRLDDELAAQPPRAVRIAGEPARWAALLDGLLIESATD